MKNHKVLTIPYLLGTVVGIAGLVWIYALGVALPFLIYIYGPMKANSLKPLWSFLFGIATPFWIALPIWLYVRYL